MSAPLAFQTSAPYSPGTKVSSPPTFSMFSSVETSSSVSAPSGLYRRSLTTMWSVLPLASATTNTVSFLSSARAGSAPHSSIAAAIIAERLRKMFFFIVMLPFQPRR